MSLGNDGRSIVCDGAGCPATTEAPIALRATLEPAERGGEQARGWLYVLGQEKTLHFCSACADGYFAGISEERDA